MDIPDTKAQVLHKKPAAWQIALPAFVPLATAYFAGKATIVIGVEHGVGTLLYVLVGWSLLQLGTAAWLNQVLFHCLKTFLPFLAAIGIVLVVWLWQRQAFTMLVPPSGFTIGYFFEPEGVKARFWIVDCPFWAGLSGLAICCISGMVSWWHAGARGSLAYMIPWWFAIFVIFALPSLYLVGHGNANRVFN